MPIWFQELVQYQLQKYKITAKSKNIAKNCTFIATLTVFGSREHPINLKLMKDSSTAQTVICATAGEWGQLNGHPRGLSLIHQNQPQA
jgi:hypothetical protein